MRIAPCWWLWVFFLLGMGAALLFKVVPWWAAFIVGPVAGTLAAAVGQVIERGKR